MENEALRNRGCRAAGWLLVFCSPEHCITAVLNPAVGPEAANGSQTLHGTDSKPNKGVFIRLQLHDRFMNISNRGTCSFLPEMIYRTESAAVFFHAFIQTCFYVSCCVVLELLSVHLHVPLSVGQVINANSVPADVAFLLLAALSAQIVQFNPLGVCVSANSLCYAPGAKQRGDLGSVSPPP